jgi:hypothetical protein
MTDGVVHAPGWLTVVAVTVLLGVFAFLAVLIHREDRQRAANVAELVIRMAHVERYLFGDGFDPHKYVECRRARRHGPWERYAAGVRMCGHCGITRNERPEDAP